MDWELWASTLLAVLVALLFDHILLVPRSKLRMVPGTAVSFSKTPNDIELRFEVENFGGGMGHLRPLVEGEAIFEERRVQVRGWAYRKYSPGVQVEPYVGPVTFEATLHAVNEADYNWLGAPGLLRLTVKPSRSPWWFPPNPLTFEANLDVDDDFEPIEPV